MPPEVLLLFFGSLFGIGGIILAGQYLERNRVKPGLEQEVQRLTEALSSLQDELGHMHDELGAIDQRMTFTERLLERPAEVEPERH